MHLLGFGVPITAMNEELLPNRVKGTLIGSALGDTIGIYTGQSLLYIYYLPSGWLHNDFGLATEFLSPEQALQAYGPVETFSLVEPVTETFQDRHRCEQCRNS
jgi:hypothetical protein